MKATNFKELNRIAKEQQYKFAALFNEQGQKLSNFNRVGTAISAQLAVLEKRLSSPALDNGVYFIYFTHRQGSKAVYDKFPIIKGDTEISESSSSSQPQIIEIKNAPKAEHILTYAGALEMQKTIAEQNFKIQWLEQQNKMLGDKIAALDADLKESEQQLSEYEKEKEPNQLAELAERAGGWLKDLAPIFAPVIEKHYTLKEKQLETYNKELELKYKAKALSKPREKKEAPREAEIGSPEHLDLIRQLDEAGEEEQVNQHLDLLEANLPDTYLQIAGELGYLEEEEPENNEEGN